MDEDLKNVIIFFWALIIAPFAAIGILIWSLSGTEIETACSKIIQDRNASPQAIELCRDYMQKGKKS